MPARAMSPRRWPRSPRTMAGAASNWSSGAGAGISRPRPTSRICFAATREEPRRLSRAATETLAIIAYHEPVSRAEIEAIRGVQISKGTLDVLMEAGWVRTAGRREGPGRPLLYATTPDFLTHFGLGSRRDLPGIDDLKAAGLLDPLDEAMRLRACNWKAATRRPREAPTSYLGVFTWAVSASGIS